ncbi:hypothetical protein P7K49_011918, partial [Saguinus oedipus]
MLAAARARKLQLPACYGAVRRGLRIPAARQHKLQLPACRGPSFPGLGILAAPPCFLVSR